MNCSHCGSKIYPWRKYFHCTTHDRKLHVSCRKFLGNICGNFLRLSTIPSTCHLEETRPERLSEQDVDYIVTRVITESKHVRVKVNGKMVGRLKAIETAKASDTAWKRDDKIAYTSKPHKP